MILDSLQACDTPSVIYFCYAGNLLKLLDVSSEESVLLTTYGKLHPPLGKQRLKVLDVYLTVFCVLIAAEFKNIRGYKLDWLLK